MNALKTSTTPRPVRQFIPLGLLTLAVTATGCGHAAPSKGKPTADEMKQMQAMVETPPVNPLAPLSERAENAYRPWGIKETAVDALGRIGQNAVPTLVNTLSDPNPRVLREAARALARIGPEAKDAVPTLIARLDDPDEDVRQAAARARPGRSSRGARRAGADQFDRCGVEQTVDHDSAGDEYASVTGARCRDVGCSAST